MITFFLAFIGFAVCVASGEPGVLVVVVVFVLFAALLGCESRANDQAWLNRREYWRKGGPDRFSRDKDLHDGSGRH